MKRVKSSQDAILWLAYWARFMGGPMGRHLKQIGQIVWEMEVERDLARERAARLAVALEKAELLACKGKGKP